MRHILGTITQAAASNGRPWPRPAAVLLYNAHRHSHLSVCVNNQMCGFVPVIAGPAAEVSPDPAVHRVYIDVKTPDIVPAPALTAEGWLAQNGVP